MNATSTIDGGIQQRFLSLNLSDENNFKLKVLFKLKWSNLQNYKIQIFRIFNSKTNPLSDQQHTNTFSIFKKLLNRFH